MSPARVCSWSSGVAVTLALILAPARAYAAGPEDAPAPSAPPPTAEPGPPPAHVPVAPPEGPHASHPESPPPVLLGPAPAPPRPPAPSVFDLVRAYGILKPTVIASSAAVESFSQPNAAAITAAGNPVLATLPKEARGTFQIAQTRLGLQVAEKSAVRGQVEIDFIDFTKASPTVASLPRLRIAKVEWAATDSFTLAAGQDWDLFSPLNPHGFDIVGAQFHAGNPGFMREQIKALYRGDVELAVAVGFQGSNNTARDAAFELARVPTGSIRFAVPFGEGDPVKTSRIGVSAIASQLRLSPGPTQRRAGAFGANLFFQAEPGGGLDIRLEGYAGRNLANIGTLALGFGAAASGDVDEVGGYVSVKEKLTPKHAIYALGGTAKVLNPANSLPSYSYPAAPAGGATPPDPSTATVAGTGPGIRWNMAARAGYEFRPLPPLALVLEGFALDTSHVLAGVDAARGVHTLRQAYGVETGMMFTF